MLLLLQCAYGVEQCSRFDATDREWAHPCHICSRTGLAPTASAPGEGSPLRHLHWTGPGSPRPHLHRDWLRRRCSGFDVLKLHLCVACCSGFDVMDQEVVVWLNSSSGWLSIEKTAQACVCVTVSGGVCVRACVYVRESVSVCVCERVSARGCVFARARRARTFASACACMQHATYRHFVMQRTHTLASVRAVHPPMQPCAHVQFRPLRGVQLIGLCAAGRLRRARKHKRHPHCAAHAERSSNSGLVLPECQLAPAVHGSLLGYSGRVPGVLGTCRATGHSRTCRVAEAAHHLGAHG